MKRLARKVAFVVGGSRGIGTGIVRKLALEGVDGQSITFVCVLKLFF